jgi:hypothetical protein
MKELEILKELFDEKIMSIIGVFLESPEKQFYLTEIANHAHVNISTTLRILKKLAQAEFVKPILISKFKVYQLETNTKIQALNSILRKEAGPLEEFIEKIKGYSMIKKIVLEEKTKEKINLMIVGDLLPSWRIDKACEEIEKSHNIKINFLELGERQFKSMKEFNTYNLDKKIIWERKNQFV